MECLLVSGFRDTGKTTTMIRMGNWLLTQGYMVAPGDVVPPIGSNQDFCVVMENPISRRRLLINSWSDIQGNADALLSFYRGREPNDILITAIRDGRIERQWIWDVVTQLTPLQVIEVPLAKITGQRFDFNQAYLDYMNRIENLCQFILSRPPFNI